MMMMKICDVSFLAGGGLDEKCSSVDELDLSRRMETGVGYIHVMAIIPRRGPLPQREMRLRSRNPSYSLRCLLLSPAMRSNPGMVKQTERRRIARSSLVGWRWAKIFLCFLNPLACVVTYARTHG
jgi:hypothetical protein